MASCCGSYGNPFVQTLFMGASIVQFSAAVSWNNADGGVTVEVAEDKCAGRPRIYSDGAAGIGITTDPDNFSPPPVGAPVFFYYGGFTVGGILNCWTQHDSADGAKTYNVQVGPPNHILAGAPVILQSYDGPTMSIPNLLNVHGYIESNCPTCGETGFSSTYPPKGMAQGLTYSPAPGWCKQSGAGWRWSQVRAALVSLLSTGYAISFRGYHYYVDISDLPVLNDEIRIDGESKTLLEIIETVCKIAGVEFFLDVIPMGAAGSCAGNLGKGPHVIKVRVGKSAVQALDQSAADVDMALCDNIEDRLNFGTISRKISESSCVNRYSRGVELCWNVFNAFITGDCRKDIWQIDQSSPLPCDGSANIWPYWGKDTNGNVILGKGCANPDDKYCGWDARHSHHFGLDISSLSINGLTNWEVTIPELRAALVGESYWRSYLANMEPDKFKQLFKHFKEHMLIDALKQLNHQDGDKPPKIRAKLLENAPKKPDDPRPKNPDLLGLSVDNVKKIIGTNTNVEWINSSKLYDYIRKYCQEYYGRKFMVKLPFICTSYDEDAPWSWGLNWQPCDAGWTDGSVLGLDPNDPVYGWVVEQFRTEDARIKPFCKFVHQKGMILDGLGKGSFYIISLNEVYVGGVVEDIVGLTPNDWRAVISLTGPVCAVPSTDVPEEWQLIHAIMNRHKQDIGKPAVDWKDMCAQFMHAGHDKSILGGHTAYIMPVSAAVTLQSKKLVYGPWYAQKDGIFNGSDNGTTEYHADTAMSPWSYGNTAMMNTAGYMIASAYVHDKYVIEKGEITFAGAPVGNIGQIIYAGGPVVNRIDVNVGRGDAAVTTTLIMRTWTPDYKQFGILRAKALHRAAQIGLKAERMFKKHALELVSTQMENSFTGTIMLEWKKTIGQMGMSSHDFLFGNNFADPENPDWARCSMVTSEPRKDLAMFRAGEWEDVDDKDLDFGGEIPPEEYEDDGTFDDEDTNDLTSTDSDDEYVDYTMTAKKMPNSCTDDGAEWRRRAYMEQIGMFRSFSTIYPTAAAKNDDGKYLSRFDKSNKPHTGKDGYVLNTEGPSSDAKGCDFFKCHSYFYPNEQVPPIYCYEHHKPITVNTLSPFLADKNMMIPDTYTDICGKEWKGWKPDTTVPLASSGVGHDIEYVARDGLYPTHLSVREDDYSPIHWYRAIALRGPLVLAGWGYDIDNYPVPNAAPNYDNWDGSDPNEDGSNKWDAEHGPKRQFADDWLRKPHTWKCGPVDLRWDYRRKVWVAPPAMKICRAVLCQWLLPDQCAGAIIYDDMMQWDNDGKGIKTEECCGKTGYKITVYSNSLRPLPKGWNITVYYDTTKQRYHLLGHDELPILEAKLDDNLYCDNCVSATILGVAGTSSKSTCNCGGSTKPCKCEKLDPCKAFTNMKIQLGNPLRQPICKDRKVFVWVCEAETDDVDDPDNKNPELGDCEKQCKKIKCLRGVILQAEFHPECFVIAIDLIRSTYYWIEEQVEHAKITYTPSGSVSGSGHLYGLATGSLATASGLCTNPVTACDTQMAASGNIPFSFNASGNVTINGSTSGQAISLQTDVVLPVIGGVVVSLSGCSTVAKDAPFSITLPTLVGSATGNVCVGITGTLTGATLDATGTFTPSCTGSVEGFHISGTPSLASTPYVNIPALSGMLTLPNYTGTIPSMSGFVNLPPYTGTVPVMSGTFTPSGTVQVSGSLGCTGGSFNTDTASLTATMGSHTHTGSCSVSCNCTSGSCSCSCGVTINASSGTVSLDPNPHSHTVHCADICGCLAPLSLSGSATFGQTTITMGGVSMTSLPISSSATVTLTSTTVTSTPNTNPVGVTVNGATANISGISFNPMDIYVPKQNVNISCSGGTVTMTGAVKGGTVTGSSCAPIGLDVVIPGKTVSGVVNIPAMSMSCGTATLPINAYASGSISMIGSLTGVNISGGSFNVPFSGNAPVCLPVKGCVTVPSTSVHGRIDDIELQTDADLSQGSFQFIGQTCTFDVQLTYNDYFTENQYDICVCWRQLFIESEVGKTVCALGGTPCTCPQDCDPNAICKPYVEWDFPCKFCGYQDYSWTGTYKPISLSGSLACSGMPSGTQPTNSRPPYSVAGAPCYPASPPTATPCSCP